MQFISGIIDGFTRRWGGGACISLGHTGYDEGGLNLLFFFFVLSGRLLFLLFEGHHIRTVILSTAGSQVYFIRGRITSFDYPALN